MYIVFILFFFFHFYLHFCINSSEINETLTCKIFCLDRCQWILHPSLRIYTYTHIYVILCKIHKKMSLKIGREGISEGHGMYAMWRVEQCSIGVPCEDGGWCIPHLQPLTAFAHELTWIFHNNSIVIQLIFSIALMFDCNFSIRIIHFSLLFIVHYILFVLGIFVWLIAILKYVFVIWLVITCVQYQYMNDKRRVNCK